MIGGVAAYLVAVPAVRNLFLEGLLGDELSIYLLVFVGLFSVQGAQKLPDQARRSKAVRGKWSSGARPEPDYCFLLYSARVKRACISPATNSRSRTFAG